MKKRLLLAVSATLCASAVSLADDWSGPERYAARLISYNEVATVSSVAKGRFSATVDEANQVITFEVSYEDLEGAVTMSHIHFGAPGTTGGISLWLCQTTISPAPASVAATTPTCPASPGTVNGTLTATAVVGPGTTPEVATAPAGQGISAGQFAEVVRAIRAGYTYANVHTVKFPAGEVRGQLRRVRGRGDRDD